jgi:hypothetical protein
METDISVLEGQDVFDLLQKKMEDNEALVSALNKILESVEATQNFNSVPENIV